MTSCPISQRIVRMSASAVSSSGCSRPPGSTQNVAVDRFLEQNVVSPDADGCHPRLEAPGIGVDLDIVRHVSGFGYHGGQRCALVGIRD